ncbi:hypothetical protein Tco_0592996 [Tanacetum coccineum]
MNCQLLDSQGPIPGMTPAQALTAIQTMADHSQKWHDGSSSRNIDSSSNSEGINAIVNKLDSLGRDMKKIKENFSANSGFLDNEKQETDKSIIEEALAALEAKLNIKKVPQEDKKSVSYYIEPYDPQIPFPK